MVRSLLILFLLATPALATPANYRVAPPPEGSKAEAVVVYSLGSHTQTATEVRGEVRVDPATLSSVEGTVVVPLAGLHGDGSTRDCHMREALGIDYKAGGRFPAEHPCDGENRLPASGPESIAFPDVRLELLSAHPLDDPALLETGTPVRVEVEGRWTVHGVSKKARELVRVLRDGKGLRARGRSTIVLKDYGVVVKSTKVLFAEIQVGDAVTLIYDLKLVPLS